jgi:hypothetical protein
MEMRILCVIMWVSMMANIGRAGEFVLADADSRRSAVPVPS